MLRFIVAVLVAAAFIAFALAYLLTADALFVLLLIALGAIVFATALCRRTR
jgi:hypothetical protein